MQSQSLSHSLAPNPTHIRPPPAGSSPLVPGSGSLTKSIFLVLTCLRAAGQGQEEEPHCQAARGHIAVTDRTKSSDELAALQQPSQRLCPLLYVSGPVQATPPPLCWSKPSRTPTGPINSQRPGSVVAWCVHSPRQRIVVGGPMLVCSSEPALERCGAFLIRCVFFARASSTMPKSAKVRLFIALPPAHLKLALVPFHLPSRSRSSQRSDWPCSLVGPGSPRTPVSHASPPTLTPLARHTYT